MVWHALMNWITVIWSMVTGASLAMASPHVLVAVKQRGAWVNRKDRIP
jgi:hypothetical protein